MLYIGKVTSARNKENKDMYRNTFDLTIVKTNIDPDLTICSVSGLGLYFMHISEWPFSHEAVNTGMTLYKY